MRHCGALFSGVVLVFKRKSAFNVQRSGSPILFQDMFKWTALRPIKPTKMPFYMTQAGKPDTLVRKGVELIKKWFVN